MTRGRYIRGRYLRERQRRRKLWRRCVDVSEAAHTVGKRAGVAAEPSLRLRSEGARV